MVVIKGPDASVGLNPSLLISSGVIVPTKDENRTTQKSAKDTMMESLLLLKNK